ncbi:MAG: hypothetical protein V4638_08220 [Bacteroidota bacterium]
MKRKKINLALAGAVLIVGFSACNKQECAECHYDDTQGNEVEIGEHCGEDLEALEANGYDVDSVSYEVHCHEH